MNVRDLMHQEFSTCGTQDTLSRAAQLMWDNDIGCLPVVDGDNHPVGMVTDRDICMAAYTQGRPLGEIAVGSAMAHGATCCEPGDSLDKATKLMRDGQIRRLPVISGGKLVGILSLNDLAVSASDGRRSELSFDAVGKTLSAVSQHRRRYQLPTASNAA